jgi:hypothetical protein
MLKSTDIYQLEKSVWTEEDFDQMGWHDVLIHAITLDSEKQEFTLDLDYIFAWVEPEPPSPYYSFWISPATLVFANIGDFKANLAEPPGITILGIERSEPRPLSYTEVPREWTWTMNLLQGEITFKATGFKQYTRKSPVRCKAQRLSLEERGGISFTRPAELIG